MEERRKILELVAEGRLTVEEGTKILDALEGPATARPAARDDPASGLLDAITRTIDIDTAGRAIALEVPRIIHRRKVKRSGGRDVDEILSFASRGAPPEFIREMKDIFPDISAGEIISLASLGVTAGYVREIRDLLEEVTAGEIISFASMGMSADDVREAETTEGATHMRKTIEVRETHDDE